MLHDKFRYYRPCSLLQPYVRYYWTFRSVGPLNTFTFPIGCPQIIFHRGAPLYIPELDTFQNRLTVSGQVNFSSHVRAGNDTDMIIVVFRPHAMSAFLGVPSSLFYNCEADGMDLGIRSLNELAERVYNSDDDDICITHIEEWLLRRLAINLSGKKQGKRAGMEELNLCRMDVAIRTLLGTPGTPVFTLASDCCLGRKQFERLFASFVGINPKEYARIVRFQKSLALLQKIHSSVKYGVASRVFSQAGLAYAGGYADQSHLIREFRRFCGRTPMELIKTTMPYSDLFTNPV